MNKPATVLQRQHSPGLANRRASQKRRAPLSRWSAQPTVAPLKRNMPLNSIASYDGCVRRLEFKWELITDPENTDILYVLYSDIKATIIQIMAPAIRAALARKRGTYRHHSVICVSQPFDTNRRTKSLW